MFELTIKNPDGSQYWKEHFNTLADANKWLNEEKTRKYWQAGFTTQIVDNTPPPPSDADVAAAAALKAQIATLKQRVKVLANQADLTAADIKEAIFKLVKAMALRGDLD
jgi:hypothetical protein